MDDFMLWTDILITASKVLLIAMPVVDVLLFLVKTALYFLERKEAAPKKREKMKKSLFLFGGISLAVLLLSLGGWWLLNPLF